MRRQATPEALPPLRDALDDEEVLAGADVAERARFARERGEARGGAEPMLELRLLPLQLLDGRPAVGELPVRVDVSPQRPVVEEPDEREHADRHPAAEQDGTSRFAASHCADFVAKPSRPLKRGLSPSVRA